MLYYICPGIWDKFASGMMFFFLETIDISAFLKLIWYYKQFLKIMHFCYLFTRLGKYMYTHYYVIYFVIMCPNPIHLHD